jgi:hypothetical protein
MGVCSDGRCATVVCQVMRDSGPVRHRGVDVSVGVLTYERPGLALVVFLVPEQWLDAVRAVLAGAEVTEAAVQAGCIGGRCTVWVGRYLTDHLAGLADRSHRPSSPRQVVPAIEGAMAGMRGAHPRARWPGGVHQPRPQARTWLSRSPRSDCAGRRLPGTWSRYRGASTQNSWPSGSAMTTQLTSPWPMSMRVAPRETRRSTSAC